jgi:Na+/citrate or Na+/malate symporter
LNPPSLSSSATLMSMLISVALPWPVVAAVGVVVVGWEAEVVRGGVVVVVVRGEVVVVRGEVVTGGEVGDEEARQ